MKGFVAMLLAIPVSLAWLIDLLLFLTLMTILADGPGPYVNGYWVPTETSLQLAVVMRLGLWVVSALVLRFSDKDPLKIIRNAAICSGAAVAIRVLLAGVQKVLTDPSGQGWRRINPNFSAESNGYDSDQNWIYIVLSTVVFLVAIPVLRAWANRKAAAVRTATPNLNVEETISAEAETTLPSGPPAVNSLTIQLGNAEQSAGPQQSGSTKNAGPKRGFRKGRLLGGAALGLGLLLFVIAKGVFDEVGGMSGLNDISEHLSPSMTYINDEQWFNADHPVSVNLSEARPTRGPCPTPGTPAFEMAFHAKECSVIIEAEDSYLFAGWEMPLKPRQVGEDVATGVDEIIQAHGRNYLAGWTRRFNAKQYFSQPLIEKHAPPSVGASFEGEWDANKAMTLLYGNFDREKKTSFWTIPASYGVKNPDGALAEAKQVLSYTETGQEHRFLSVLSLGIGVEGCHACTDATLFSEFVFVKEGGTWVLRQSMLQVGTSDFGAAPNIETLKLGPDKVGFKSESTYMAQGNGSTILSVEIPDGQQIKQVWAGQVYSSECLPDGECSEKTGNISFVPGPDPTFYDLIFKKPGEGPPRLSRMSQQGIYKEVPSN